MPISNRSPLSPHALTVAEIERLAPGTTVVVYCATYSPPTREFEYLGIEGESVLLKPTPPWPTTPPDYVSKRHLTDAGLVSYVRGGWNDGNCIVLPEHRDSLPATPPVAPRTGDKEMEERH